MLERNSLELMKVNKEDFYITCIEDLNIGEMNIVKGIKLHIVESQLVELEPNDNMVVYIVENENFGLCDMEIDEYFIINK